MASSSYSFIVVSFAVLLVSSSSQTSTKPIDAICTYDDFCIKSLIKYPPAASATTTPEAAAAALRLVMSYADKFADFALKAAKKNPNLKEQFEECQSRYQIIKSNLKSATEDLVQSPGNANYLAIVCRDHMAMVNHVMGKNTDKDSKEMMKLNYMMEKLIDIAIKATVAVAG